MSDDTREQATATTPPPPPTPPTAEAFAARYGLIRPLRGRYVAGVCAALGRATNTDPVLWRVLLPVLVCFGGVGALVYLSLWLLTPEEGDTGSPVEAMLGRGRSNTSPVLVVLLGVLAGITALVVLPGPFNLAILAGTVMLVLALVMNQPRAGTAPMTPPADPSPPTSQPGATPTTQDAPPSAAAATTTVTDAPPPSAAAPPGPAPGLGGYRPPFAPHGPFMATAPPPPPAPRPTKESSPLTAITFFAALLTVGALGAGQLTGLVKVPAAGYVAAALATVGGGLLVGAWLGRGRLLIVLGAVLALALPVVHVTGAWQPPEHIATSVTWAPGGYAELDDVYEIVLGEATLDLRGVDFTGRDATVTARVTAGEMRVLVPPDVAVEANVDLRAAEATVLGTRVDGAMSSQSVVEVDAGDPAAGVLRLHLTARFANIEVH